MSVFQNHISDSENKTLNLAKQLSKVLNADDIILLNGTLGAGKSVFARGIIQSLSLFPDEDIPSPTFTLVQQYETPNTYIWHYDLYRLNNPEEIYETGWEDILYQDIILIEWAEKLQHLKPSRYINVTIDIDNNNLERFIKIEKIGY